MLSLILAASILQSPVAQIDALAQKRDEAGMARFAAADLVANKRFHFLVQNSTYETGRYGWHALDLQDPASGKKYVVFSTRLTSEDMGEQVFELRNGRLVRYIDEANDLGFLIEHHDFQVSFDIPLKKAMLTDKVRFHALPESEHVLLTRMSPNYRISSVKDSSGRAIRFAQAGGVAIMAMPYGGVGTGRDIFTYTLKYSAIVDQPNYAGSITSTEATLTNDYWYPMIARGPSTHTAKVIGPQGWLCISQGEPDATNTRYRMNLPVTYFSLTAGAFKKYETRLNGREYRVWSTRMTRPEMANQAELNRDVVEFYDRTFGKFPFSGWGTLESPHYGGGALEAYSYATYGMGGMPDLDAHEPAHTWFGGMINNTYLHSLWNESFAVYCDGLYHRDGPIGDIPEKRLAFVDDATPNTSYNAATCENSPSAIGPAASALGYGKGAKVLQMLEQELGTKEMLHCMREWVATHPKGKPGEWTDFEKVVGRVTGKDYGWFFSQWLRRKGWPDFELVQAGMAGDELEGTIKWNSEPYSLLCDVLVRYDHGEERFEKVRLDARGKFNLHLPPYRSNTAPTLVSLDPWRRLLRRYGTDEAPVQLSRFVGRVKYYVDPAHKDWLSEVRGDPSRAIAALPDDLDGLLVIGSPETLPVMKELCDKAGFEVSGGRLSYDGTTIDLDKGAAFAVVDLGEGKRCAIGLGKIELRPQLGRSRLCLVDRLGRFLRGTTDPKVKGFLTMPLGRIVN